MQNDPEDDMVNPIEEPNAEPTEPVNEPEDDTPEPVIGGMVEEEPEPSSAPEYRALSEKITQLEEMLREARKPEVPAYQQPGLPPLPFGFENWPESAKREWAGFMLQRGVNNLPPEPKNTPEDTRSTFEKFWQEKEQEIQKRQMEETRVQAISDFHESSKRANAMISSVLQSIPRDVRDKVRTEAIEEYERSYPGFRAPVGKFGPNDVFLYGERKAPEVFADMMEAAAFRANVGYIPDWVKKHYKANYDILRGEKKPEKNPPNHSGHKPASSSSSYTQDRTFQEEIERLGREE